MKKKIIFDASVLVNAYLSGAIFNTGIFRVSFEVLSRLTHYEEFSIYLYDIYLRERELRKFVLPKFNSIDILPVDSKIYKIIAYPIFDMSEYFRTNEYQTNNNNLKFINRFLKNCFQTLGRACRYIERKRKIPADHFHFNDTDLYFSTYNKFPIDVSFLSKLRKTIIVHDLIPILYPEYFYDQENKQIMETIIDSISDNDRVICVSESTKSDFFKIRTSFDPINIFVTRLAGAACFQPVLSSNKLRTVKEKYLIPTQKNYFLSVCTIEPRKNIDMLIRVYEKLLKFNKTDELQILVLTGVIGWKSQILIDHIKQINADHPNCIILTGFVTDEELSVLYSNTIGFIYPSLYEGFGLPPLEAMKCGAPVITSDNSSLPEVVGSAGIMIDARNEDALLNAMLNCMDEDKTKDMREKSLQRAALFSWDKTVEEIVNILNSF